MDKPFMVGELVPGNCYIADTRQGDELRVEAVGVDWIVLRHNDGRPRWYAGSHADLRQEVEYALKDQGSRAFPEDISALGVPRDHPGVEPWTDDDDCDHLYNLDGACQKCRRRSRPS